MKSTRSLILIIVLFTFYGKLSSQFFIKEFETEISIARDFLVLEVYDSAAISFEKALNIMDGNSPFPHVYYEAAKCWAVSGDKDKAFNFLSQFGRVGWADIDKIKKDTLFKSLHSDKRWEIFQEDIERKYIMYHEVQKELERIGIADQVFRRIYTCLNERNKEGSNEIEFYHSLSLKQDTENLRKVDSIVAIHGWLGVSQVGKKGNDALWKVVQHSSPYVIERYLPLVEHSVKIGETSPSNYAIMVDRHLTYNNKKQIYGSQFVTISETGEKKVITVEDPESINQRRRSIGLSKIEDYLQLAGINTVTIESLSDPSTLQYLTDYIER